MTTIASRNDVDAMKRILFLAVLGHKPSRRRNWKRRNWLPIQWRENIGPITSRVALEFVLSREWNNDDVDGRQMQNTDPNHDEWQNLLTLSVREERSRASHWIHRGMHRSTEELAGRTIIVELYNCIQFRCYLGGGCWIYYVIHDVHGPYSCWMTTTTTKMDRRRGVQSVL